MNNSPLYNYEILVSLLQCADYNNETPFKEYMGNLILEHKLFGPIMEIARHEKGNIAFRAAWGIEYAFFKQPDSFSEFISKFITDFHKIENESVRRHYGKMMYTLLSQKRIIPDTRHAEAIAETVCTWMTAPKTKIGTKVWCLDILHLLRPHADWIAGAMEDLIAQESVSPTPGMKCRIKKLNRYRNKKV